MSDLRITKLARLLVHYSLDIKPGQMLQIRTHPVAEELTLAVYEEAIKAGANVLLTNIVPGTDELFYKYASDSQLDFVSPVRNLVAQTFDASLNLWTEHNTHEMSAIDPARIARFSKASSAINITFMDRAAKGELHWCLTVYPCQALAQEADMSLADYREFVFGAGMLNEQDPAAFWRNEGENLRKIAGWLGGREQVVLKGSNVELKMSIKDRKFIPCHGKVNFPDGEIFTGPVEDSVEGWVRFKYPAIEFGKEVSDIELWFEKGRVVKEKAGKNQEFLTSLLNTDAGSRTLGEFGIGTNYGITRFTKNMLFDEKMGGTIHLAVGLGYPETGSKNESGIHWDMLCDMNDAEIIVDGDRMYRNGKFAI